MEKKPFITLEQAKDIIKDVPTPFHIYDERGIRENARALNKAFSWNKGYKEFFAVKATPNPYLMKILQEEGCGMDCSSYTELMLCESCGITGKNIMFSSNVTPAEDMKKAYDLGAMINLDDYTHVEFIKKVCGVAFLELKEAGAVEFGIHAFLASNTVSNGYYPELAGILFELAVRLQKKTGVHIKFVNLSGGVGVDYKPEEPKNDIAIIGDGVRKKYEEILVPAGMNDVEIYTELGRYMLAPFGALVATAIHEKHIYKEYIGLDACAANLMRPAMYGSYHHITVLGKENAPCDHKYDVTGGLCENNTLQAVCARTTTSSL